MEILSRANWVDLLVVTLMIRTVYVSLKDGLSHEIFPLLGSVLTLILGLHYYGRLGSMLYGVAGMIPLSMLKLASFLAIIVISGFILKMLKILVDAVIKVTWHPFIEKFGGMLAGVLRGMVVTSMALICLALVPLSYLQWSIKERSVSGMFFLRIGPGIYRTVSGGRIDDGRITDGIIAKKNIPVKGKDVKKAPEWEKAPDLNDVKKSGGTR
jgi:membrane protein required for colicin V production